MRSLLLSSLIKGRWLIILIVGISLVVGVGSVGAAPTHQETESNTPAVTTVPSVTASPTANATNCPGQPEAQQLATTFSLSTQVICTLHDGTFQGVDHALGYGEIDQLLTDAEELAQDDNSTLDD
jgi:hypothetical protein